MNIFNLFKSGITVEIFNLTNNTLANIVIEYRTGKEVISILLPTKKNSFLIRPTDESDLQLSFENSGKRIVQTINTYFDKNYKGKLELRIKGDNSVDVIDNIII